MNEQHRGTVIDYRTASTSAPAHVYGKGVPGDVRYILGRYDGGHFRVSVPLLRR
jgi:hypothetical protein